VFLVAARGRKINTTVERSSRMGTLYFYNEVTSEKDEQEDIL
jgi:hypothetical protein